jgi:hypothetical protein
MPLMLAPREHDAIARAVDVDAIVVEKLASSLLLGAGSLGYAGYDTSREALGGSPASVLMTKESRVPRIQAAMLLSLGLFLNLLPPARADGLPDPTKGSAPGAVPLGIGAYPPSLFRFITTLPDDGQGKGGGWQVASARLDFVDARHLVPKIWTCLVEVGMPLRTMHDGKISAYYAAQVTAEIATEASLL